MGEQLLAKWGISGIYPAVFMIHATYVFDLTSRIILIFLYKVIKY